MADTAPLKAAISASLDNATDALTTFGEDIFDHAELGFREERTAARVADALRRLGLAPREGLALTGVSARLDGSSSGPTIALIGELDGLLVPDHPRAQPSTGVVHACGHNAQVAMMVGAGMALREIAPQLAGRIHLDAPAMLFN